MLLFKPYYYYAKNVVNMPEKRKFLQDRHVGLP